MTTDVGNVPAVITGGGGDLGGNGIWAILLLALLGGGGIFGGRGGAEALSTDMIMNQMNSRFNSLDAANEFRFMAQANNINHISTLEQMHDNDQAICATQMMIEQAKNEGIKGDSATQLLLAQGFAASELNATKCCCETQKEIVESRIACAANTQKVLDALAADKIDRLKDEISQLRSAVAKPAYITLAPGQAYYPPYNATAFGGCAAGF